MLAEGCLDRGGVPEPETCLGRRRRTGSLVAQCLFLEVCKMILELPAEAQRVLLSYAEIQQLFDERIEIRARHARVPRVPR